MKTKSFKRVLALALATVTLLTACGQKPATNTSESKTSEPAKTSESTPAASEEEKPVAKEDLPVITMYPASAALFSGLVTGNRSDLFAEYGFQMEVWAYSDEKTNAMFTSGDLPDMFYVGSGQLETLEMLIETEKIINYEDYKDQLPNYFADPYDPRVPEVMDKIKAEFSAGTNGLYVLPVGLGNNSGIFDQTGTFDRNVVKLKWDVYEAIGAPEITDMWQLLDVVEDMLEYAPTAADGTKMFGTFLDNGMDTNYWGGMELWYTWHGYTGWQRRYLVEVDGIEGTIGSIFDEDSCYKEGLKWYYEINQRGLMDPDSISTSRTDQAPKLDNGYAMMPAGTLPGWQTKYYEIFVPGLRVQRNFDTATMGTVTNCIVINAKSENIDECLAFVNMIADPYMCLQIQYGPEGVMWEKDGNTLKITDAFADWLAEKGNVNFFPMGDGTEWSTWNTAMAVNTGVPMKDYVDVNGDPICYIPTTWPDAQAITTNNDNWNAWKESQGAEDLWDYCEQHDITVYAADCFSGATLPTPDDSQNLTYAAIKDVVVSSSWNMVYAKDEEEFEKIWDQMVEDAMALGAQELIDWYIENYKPVKTESSVTTKPE